jgi:hypothetical protein
MAWKYYAVCVTVPLHCQGSGVERVGEDYLAYLRGKSEKWRLNLVAYRAVRGQYRGCQLTVIPTFGRIDALMAFVASAPCH